MKLTIREASDYTGLPTGTIAYAAKSDPPRLRSFRSGPFGPYWFEKSDLDAWLSDMESAPPPRKQKSRTKNRRTPANS